MSDELIKIRPSRKKEKGIDWNKVKQERADQRTDSKYIISFLSAKKVAEASKEIALEKGIEVEDQALDFIMFLVSSVVADFIDLAGADDSLPLVMPDKFGRLKSATAGFILKDDLPLILINLNGFIEASRVMSKFSRKEDFNSKDIEVLSNFLFNLAHELSHFRQYLSDPNYKEYVDSKEYNKPSHVFTEDSFAAYKTDPYETNAMAVATRYVIEKQTDDKAAAIWKNLNFGPIMEKHWTEIFHFIDHKKGLKGLSLIARYKAGELSEEESAAIYQQILEIKERGSEESYQKRLTTMLSRLQKKFGSFL